MQASHLNLSHKMVKKNLTNMKIVKKDQHEIKNKLKASISVWLVEISIPLDE